MKFVSKIMTFDASAVGTERVSINVYGSASILNCNPTMTDLLCSKFAEFMTSMGVDVVYDSETKYTYINGVPFLIFVYLKLNYAGTSAGSSATPNRSMYKILVVSPYYRIAYTTHSASWPTTSLLFSYNECGSILFDELTKTATVKFRFCGTSKNFYFLIGSAAMLRRTTANTNSNYFYITETSSEAFASNYYCGAFFFFSGKDHLLNKPVVFYGAQLNSFTSNNYFFVIEEDDDGTPFEPVSGVVSKAFSASYYYPASYNRDSNEYLVNYFLSDGFALDCYFRPNGGSFPGATSFYADNTTVFTSNGKNFWAFPYVLCIVDVTEG